MTVLIYSMIYAGSALMAYNVFQYVRFARNERRREHWSRESRILRIPIILLILFLAGYLAVGLFGKPDVIMAAILFGGSIFVFFMLLLIRRTVDRILDSEQLKAKLAAAEEANKAKTFFLSNMSHDLRTPLNAITGYTALAKANPEKQAEYIEKIEAAGTQLLKIVNDVLDMSYIESGKLDLKPVRFNLEKCVQITEELLRNQVQKKKIQFDSFCEITHRWVRCDENLFSRVLMNLLSNAVKFTKENGAVSLTLKELRQEGENAVYEIRVRDTGIGMDPEFVERIFSPFERERTSTDSNIQGTGLGMAITKSIVDLMGGSIEVQTEKGVGTEFRIVLSFPIEKLEEETPKTPVEEIRFDGLRVLLTEDNEINAEIAEMLLSEAGFTVERAVNGQNALEKVQASAPGYYDLILMDVQMPVMNGHAAARAIRALPDPAQSKIPIIAMTANAFQEDIKAAESAGMNAHIAKPINVPVMLNTIKTVLASKE